MARARARYGDGFQMLVTAVKSGGQWTHPLSDMITRDGSSVSCWTMAGAVARRSGQSSTHLVN